MRGACLNRIVRIGYGRWVSVKKGCRSLVERARAETTHTSFSERLERYWGWGMARWCEILGSIDSIEVIGSL